MLNARLNHDPITRSVRVIAASILMAVSVPLAGFGTSAQTASAAFSGFVFDVTGAPVPSATVELAATSRQPVIKAQSNRPLTIRFTNAKLMDVLKLMATSAGIQIAADHDVTDRPITFQLDGVNVQQAFDYVMASSQLSYRVINDRSILLVADPTNVKHNAQSDLGGYFQFPVLPAGTYFLRARLPGFTTLQDTVTIPAGHAQRNLTLQVGSLEETVTVFDNRGQSRAAGPPERLQTVRQRALEKCSGSSRGTTGGNIVPPTVLTKVQPEYPEHLKSAKVGGVVNIEAIIGTDGNMREVSVITSPHPDLGSAAAEAIRQWQFSSTLLNCVPIEVRMHVTTRFVSEP